LHNFATNFQNSLETYISLAKYDADMEAELEVLDIFTI